MKKQDAFLFPQLLGKVLVVVLPLLIVISITVGTSLATRSHSTSTPNRTPTPLLNTIHYDLIEQTPVPGAVNVKVTLAEYTIGSSVTAFHAGKTYYFVVANRGHEVHEFLIMPVKPDGSALPPDVQYKDKLIEIEQIAPGTTLTINYTFSPSSVGHYEIACQMRGHYLAGMRLPIRVT